MSGGRTGAGRALRWSVTALAALFCALSGWSYQQARSDDGLETAHTREFVLTAGRQHLARLNSIDPVDADAGLRQWLDAATGRLRDQLERTRTDSVRELRKAGVAIRGTVTGAAVTDLDIRAGTARLIAAVSVEVTPQDGAPTTDRKRFEVDLTRTPGGWKLRSLTAIPLGGG